MLFSKSKQEERTSDLRSEGGREGGGKEDNYLEIFYLMIVESSQHIVFPKKFRIEEGRMLDSEECARSSKSKNFTDVCDGRSLLPSSLSDIADRLLMIHLIKIKSFDVEDTKFVRREDLQKRAYLKAVIYLRSIHTAIKILGRYTMFHFDTLLN